MDMSLNMQIFDNKHRTLRFCSPLGSTSPVSGTQKTSGNQLDLPQCRAGHRKVFSWMLGFDIFCHSFCMFDMILWRKICKWDNLISYSMTGSWIFVWITFLIVWHFGRRAYLRSSNLIKRRFSGSCILWFYLEAFFPGNKNFSFLLTMNLHPGSST